MGHRANYVIVEPDGYALYHSHWGALTAPVDVFWGPDHAARFIERQEPCQPGQWLDDIWAEGGALLDPQQKRLILFGGDELSCEIPLRRLYLTLLATVWDAWRVSWAYEGLADFADHLGLDRALVLSDPKDRIKSAGPLAIAGEFAPSTICSLDREDGTTALYPLATMIEQLLPRGPNLIGQLSLLPPVDRLEIDLGGDDCPDGGLHFDPARRSVSAWLAAPAPDLPQRMAAWWPGWSFTWHRDNHESHRELTGGRLVFAEPTRGALIEALSAILLAEPGRNPVERMLDLVGHLEEQGRSVELNPRSLAHETLDLPREERRRVFEAAVSELRLAG